LLLLNNLNLLNIIDGEVKLCGRHWPPKMSLFQ